jgi:hypothetical protein
MVCSPLVTAALFPTDVAVSRSMCATLTKEDSSTDLVLKIIAP